MQYMGIDTEKSVFIPVLLLFWSKSAVCKGFAMSVPIITEK